VGEGVPPTTGAGVGKPVSYQMKKKSHENTL
jgi:hypothetical protein